MNGKQLILGTGLLALVCGLPTAAQQNSAHDTKAASHLTDGKQSSKDDKQGEGQRIFATASVLKTEEELLGFFNP